MLHGKATIELHNNKTHQDEKIVHDNMLTNWLRDSFYPPQYEVVAGGATGAANRINLTKTAANIFGGLIMFDTVLSTNADDYYFPNPSTAKMVAHADNNVYNGVDIARGSYNAAASSIGAGTITRVWDFTQEKGNGTINSLGLCYAPFGKIGSGLDNKLAINSTNMVSFYDSYLGTISLGLVNIPDTYNASRYYDPANSKVYLMKLASGILTIDEAWYPSTTFNPLRNGIPQTSSLYIDYSVANPYGPYQSTNIDLTQYLGTLSKAEIFGDDRGYLYIMVIITSNGGQWTNNDTRTFIKVDIAAKTYTTFTLTNNTGQTLVGGSTGTSGSGTPPTFGVKGDYMYFKKYNTSTSIYYINMNDNTECGEVLFENGASVSGFYSGESSCFCNCGNWLICAYNIYPDASKQYNSTNVIYIIDGEKAYQPCVSSFGYIGSQGASMGKYGIYQFNAGYTFCIPSLATKLNLDSPVTKTSDMDMRVTYTITDTP